MGAKIFWIVIVLLFIGGNLVYFSPGKLELVDANPKPTLTQLSTTKTTDTLQKTDSTVGTGKEAQKGNTLTVHYRGTLSDGKEFDSSYSRNEPFTFELGAGNVIQGWDQGLVGMKEGGKRTLTIPPALGYGEAGSPPTIPPNATLTFEIELLNVE